MNASKTSLTLALTAMIGAAGIAHAASNPFAAQSLSQGYLVADAHGKTAEGKCGGDKAKEGNCGGSKTTKAKDGKCGEGKCGAKKTKAKEGSCGGDKAKEGKCGGNK
ncbi:MAG: hypothetical protein AB1560_11910 [Pseudomonadota bacterium]